MLRGRHDGAQLLTRLLQADHIFASCSITVTEIFAGMNPSEELRTRAFVGSLSYLPITPEIAEQAGLLRRDWAKRGQTLSLPDATLAAVAIAHRCVLVTANVKDFPMPEVTLLAC